MDFEESLKPQLFEFLKIAELQKTSKHCDLNKYELWKRIIPIDESLRKEIATNSGNNQTTTLTDDKIDDDSSELENATNSADESLQISTTDLIFAIKENLESEETLSDDLLKNLQVCQELEAVFGGLFQHLKGTDVYNFGNYLINRTSDQKVVKLYCRQILIPFMLKEHSDSLQRLLNELLSRNYGDLRQEVLSEIKKHHTRAFLLYLSHLNCKYKSEILRCFVSDVEKLERNHLELIDSLLNSAVEFEILRKIVELLSNQCDEFNCEKLAGKLLINIIEFSQQNIVQLQQPLQRLIDTHQSVWRGKLRKKFDCCFEDTMNFSQSFHF